MFGWLGSSSNTVVPHSLKDLQGEWKVIRIGKDGNRAPRFLMWLVDIRFRIEGDRYTTSAGGEVIEQGKLQFQSKANFAWLDQHVESGDDAGQVHLGIVRLVTGRLEHLQAEIGCERPLGFPYNKETKGNMALMKRV